MIKLLLMSKTQKTEKGVKFKKFFTSVKIVVKGEEEKGLQNKTLNVRFDKSIDTHNYFRGLLTIDDKDIDIPYKFEIREITNPDGTTQKLVYPYVYIRKVKNYEERKPQTTATFDLLDESDTEEVEIKESK